MLIPNDFDTAGRLLIQLRSFFQFAIVLSEPPRIFRNFSNAYITFITDSLYILIKNGRLLRLIGGVLISHIYHAPIMQTKGQ